MYYKLKKDIYIVEGACNNCIYDLSKGKLYSINDNALKFIKMLVANGIESSEYNDNQKNYIRQLLNGEIIEKSNERVELASIKELKERINYNFAWIEVTKKCNLRCIHCYDCSLPECNDEMDIDDFKMVINELQEFGIKSIQLIGGEPFVLGEKLKQMISYCNNKFDPLEIFTNGTLINEQWANYLKKFNIKIALSLYSYNEKEHEKVTVTKESFGKTKNAIDLLEKYNIKYRVERIKMKDISVELKGDEKFDIVNNYDLVRISGRGNLKLYDKELLKEKLRTEESFKSPISRKKIVRNVSGHNCFSSKLYISANLTVFPCVMERRISHGNLNNCVKLSDLLDKNIIRFNKDKIRVCKDCEYRYACFDCRPDSISKDYRDKPWCCTYNPYNGKWTEINEFIKGVLNN